MTARESGNPLNETANSSLPGTSNVWGQFGAFEHIKTIKRFTGKVEKNAAFSLFCIT